MKKETQKPTEAELEILQVLWKKGPATVREINEQLSEKRDVGYTTTLKLMQIMYSKNLLQRREEGRTHIYKAIIKESDIQKELTDKFLETVFGGSAQKLVLQALGSNKPTSEELEEIKQLLNKLENKNAGYK